MDGPDSRNELGHAAIFTVAGSRDVAWQRINTRWVEANGLTSVELSLDGVQCRIVKAPTSGFGFYMGPRLNRARLRSSALPVTR